MSTNSIDSNSFDAIAKLAYSESGLQLVAEKTSMIQSRLRHRLKAVGIDSFAQYADFVCSNDGVSERRQMISALTTNVSHFFREQHHFDILVDHAIPKMLGRLHSGDRLRIWSAGCSNGQEAYSIAISLIENFPEIGNLDFKILATDIDPNVVQFAREAIYPERLVSSVPSKILQKYFNEKSNEPEKSYVIADNLKPHVVFKELNLLSDWPMKNEMNVIFCRNVVIYFDLETQNRLWPRFRNILAEDGYLFLGHSERISEPHLCGFANDGPTSYRPSIQSKT